jgi:hypothetical protein
LHGQRGDDGGERRPETLCTRGPARREDRGASPPPHDQEPRVGCTIPCQEAGIHYVAAKLFVFLCAILQFTSHAVSIELVTRFVLQMLQAYTVELEAELNHLKEENARLKAEEVLTSEKQEKILSSCRS